MGTLMIMSTRLSQCIQHQCDRRLTGLTNGCHQGQLFRYLLAAYLLFATGCVGAHEYWLDPVGSLWRVGDTLQADIRNGQDLVGTAFPFSPETLARAGLISDEKRVALRGRLGDYPAFQLPIQEGGLHLLLLETTRRQVTYETMDEFEVFLSEHALTDFADRHRQRALPETDILEHYYRYCKALINVASSREIDTESRTRSSLDALEQAVDSPSTTYAQLAPALQPQDQRLELMVAENPLGSTTMSVRVLFEGTPLADRQIELFHRGESATVTKTIKQSDDDGFAHFDVAAAGDYLINSVWIEVPPDSSAHWKTSWASFFFQQIDDQGD